MTLMTLTKDNFDQTVESKDIVLVDFWAEWCMPCKAFAEVFERVASQYPDLVFGQVDVEAEPELAADFGVQSVPHLLVIRQQVAVYLESGNLPESALHELIGQAKALDMAEVKRNLADQAKKS